MLHMLHIGEPPGRGLDRMAHETTAGRNRNTGTDRTAPRNNAVELIFAMGDDTNTFTHFYVFCAPLVLLVAFRSCH